MGQFADAMRGALYEEADKLKSVTAAAVEVISEDVVDELRIETQRGGLPYKLANAWRLKKYNMGSARAAGFIYSAAPDIHFALGNGVTLKPLHGKYLAIPTNFNRVAGRSAGQPRITPERMSTMKGLTFIVNGKNGTKYWMLRVAEAQSVDKKKTQLYAGGQAGLLVGSGKHKAGWQKQVAKYGAVPMFVLAPRAVLRKRFDYQSILDNAPNKLAAEFLAAYDKI